MNKKLFQPHPLFPGGHLQTILGHVVGKVPPPQNYHSELVDLPDGDQLVLHIDPAEGGGDEQPLVLLMHGLGGCSESYYNLRISRHLVKHGYTVIRFNHRTCSAQGLQLARQIYHAGRSDDLGTTLGHIKAKWNRPILLVGFSLSGNIVLKFAGEQREKIYQSGVKKILSVCPPTDLEYCSRFFSRPTNSHLDQYFSQLLLGTAKRRDQLHQLSDSKRLPKVFNLRQFDELYTAPLGGFNSRRDYYDRSSAAPLMGDIKVETLILGAADDPIVPAEHLLRLQSSDQVQIHIEAGGGHMGFLGRKKTPLGDNRWMDAMVVNWVLGASARSAV